MVNLSIADNDNSLDSGSINHLYNNTTINSIFGPSLIWIILIQWIVTLPLIDSCEKFKLITSIIFSTCLIIIRLVSSSLNINQLNCHIENCADNQSNQFSLIVDYFVSIFTKVIFTTLWSILWMRWTLPCNYFTFNRQTYNRQQLLPICLIVCLFSCLLSNNLITHFNSFLIFMITFLWLGTGSYFIGRLQTNPGLLLFPVIGLTGLEISKAFISSFSYGKTIEILIETVLISLATLLLSCGLDKSRCIQDLFPIEFPVYCSLARKNLLPFIRQTFNAFVRKEIDLDQTVFDDFNVCLKILKHHCETLTVSLPFYTSSARVDVTIAYAFIRVSDDLVDDGQLNMKQRLVNHKIILKFMDQLFSSRNEKWTYDVGQPIDSANKPPVNWEYYKSNLPLEAYQVLKAYARTVYYQPSGPMKDLVSTYSWDLEEKHIANEKELIEFARCAGGGIMAAFHCIQLYKSGLYPNGISPLERPFIDTFYAIGQAMQLVNIARDIVHDSTTDGRCYIPAMFMENSEKEIDLLTNKKTPWALGVETLSKYSKLIVALSYYCCSKVPQTLNSMPGEVRKPLMIFSEIYRTIGSQILKHEGFEKRIFVPLYKKIWIALSYLYFNRKHI